MSGIAAAKRPTATARMICGAEIRESIEQTFDLQAPPSGHATWNNRLYTCTYRLPAGTLVLSVKDSLNLATGNTYFTRLQQQAEGAKPLRGLLAFGLPSYETADGTVVFLKDGKTLTADATALPVQAGPGHQSRTDVAYAIAADVVACWSE